MFKAYLQFPPIWAIYDHPRDYPDDFVVRVWYGDTPAPDVQLAPTLVQARELAVIAGASFPLGRGADDDRCIAECWI